MKRKKKQTSHYDYWSFMTPKSKMAKFKKRVADREFRRQIENIYSSYVALY